MDIHLLADLPHVTVISKHQAQAKVMLPNLLELTKFVEVGEEDREYSLRLWKLGKTKGSTLTVQQVQVLN